MDTFKSGDKVRFNHNHLNITGEIIDTTCISCKINECNCPLYNRNFIWVKWNNLGNFATLLYPKDFLKINRVSNFKCAGIGNDKV